MFKRAAATALALAVSAALGAAERAGVEAEAARLAAFRRAATVDTAYAG